jgi:rhomboid protease GluP
MAETSALSMEDILRLCAGAAPQPWYHAVYARDAGIPRDSLDLPLEQLRMAGLIRLTPWVNPQQGQGYALTPEGMEVLNNPRALAEIRAGRLPRRQPEPVERPRPTGMTTWDRGEAIRDALLTPSSPLVTFGLIAINVLVFLYGLILAQQQGIPWNRFLAGGDSTIALESGSLVALHLAQGEWWRLLTCCFVHFGLLHLGLNMYGLYIVGPLLERMWGHVRFLGLYLIAGLGSSCIAMILKPYTLEGGMPRWVNLGGASGALCGIMASAAVWIFFNRIYLSPAAVSAWARALLINFVLIVIISSAANVSAAAHFGGAVVGAVAAVLLHFQRFGATFVQRGLALGALLALPVVCVGALIWYQNEDSLLRKLHAERHPRRAQLPPPATPEEAERRKSESLKFFGLLVPDIEGVTRAARKALSEFAGPLIDRKPEERSSARVKEALAALARQRTELNRLLTDLQDQDPFTDPQIQDALDIGKKYVEAVIALVQTVETALPPSADWEQKKAAVDKQGLIMGELYQRWRAALQGSGVARTSAPRHWLVCMGSHPPMMLALN